MTGATETGKSTLARALFLSAAAPRLVIDPQDSDATAIAGAVTFHDPARPPADAATARFVPFDPDDLDAYDAIYRWVFGHFPRYVWADEAGDVFPVKRTPLWPRKVLTHGRKREIGHLACHTRPREVNPNLIAQAKHSFIFDTPNPDDRRRLADLIGLPPAVLDAELARLPEFGFLWWAQRDRRLTVCPPLTVRR